MLRVVGEHDRRRRAPRRRPAAASTGQVLTFSHAADRRAGDPVALERRDEPARRSASSTTWVESRLAASAPGRSSASASAAVERGRVVDADADPPSCAALESSTSSASARSRARPVGARAGSKANSVADPGLGRARRGAAGPSSSRRSVALVALAGGLQEADRRPRPASPRARPEHALDPQVVEGASRCARRRPAGRRSRTGSGSRSWSPRACRGRARSPRRAARRPAPRAARSRPGLRLRSEQLARPPRRRSAGRARAFRRCEPRERVGVHRRSSRGTGSAASIVCRQTSTGIPNRGERSQGTWTICIRPSSAS